MGLISVWKELICHGLEHEEKPSRRNKCLLYTVVKHITDAVTSPTGLTSMFGCKQLDRKFNGKGKRKKKVVSEDKYKMYS